MKAWVSKWREAIFSFSLIHNKRVSAASSSACLIFHVFIYLIKLRISFLTQRDLCLFLGLNHRSFIFKWKVQNWAKKKKTLIFLSIYMCFCFWVQWSWPVEIINYIVGFLFESMLDAFLPSQLKWAFPSDRVKCGSVPVTNPLTAA